MTTCRGSGPGGQHRNNTASAVILRHLPTDIQVRVESERSQHRNRELAMGLLRARILRQREVEAQGNRAEDRRSQLGSGMRGDKRRTIRMQDDRVVDHVTKKKMKASRYLKGYVEELSG
jgi:peptide chain release factor 1